MELADSNDVRVETLKSPNNDDEGKLINVPLKIQTLIAPSEERSKIGQRKTKKRSGKIKLMKTTKLYSSSERERERADSA